MKILVIGGYGFIGSHVTLKLNDLGYEAIAVSRRNDTDLFSLDSIKNCLNKHQPKIIINCAANVGSVNYVSEFSADVISSNIQMAINLYKSVGNNCPQTKIINPLSNCSYPGESDYQKESDWLIGDVHDSVFSYGNAKRIIYLIAKCYQKQFGVISSNFLIPNTFGPGDSLDPNKTHALNGMIVRMINAKIAELKDIKVDNNINLNVNKILNNVILKKDDLQNKIYFKNLLNEAIKSYAG